MQVLDKGFVELEDFMGGDLRVVNAAKVSNHKSSSEMGASEVKLIHYLMKHRHGSPFEHSYFTFRVKAPLFVVREWQRHRIGSFNEMSGRYVEFEPEFYQPDKWRIPSESNKQGSVLPPEDQPEWWNTSMSSKLTVSQALAFTYYRDLIDKGVAKEMARIVLPLSLYTEFYWTVNARSLMNFLSLRTGWDAQWEIRQFASAVESSFFANMPDTWTAWGDNGRIAP